MPSEWIKQIKFGWQFGLEIMSNTQCEMRAAQHFYPFFCFVLFSNIIWVVWTCMQFFFKGYRRYLDYITDSFLAMPLDWIKQLKCWREHGTYEQHLVWHESSTTCLTFFFTLLNIILSGVNLHANYSIGGCFLWNMKRDFGGF